MIAALVAALLAPTADAVAERQAPSVCSAAAYRQFDFWIGKWTVVDLATGQNAGSSLIERVYDGCVIRENWVSNGFSGGSLNSFWSGDGRWHQTWMDSAGAFRHFIGGLDADGRMVMTARQPLPGTSGERLVRLTFTANPDGTVRQYSDYSENEGKTWKPRYDFLYKPLARQ